MTAYTLTIPKVIPGRVTRSDNAQIVEPQKITATNPPTVVGNAVKIDANGLHPIGASDTTASVYGVLLDPFMSGTTLTAGTVQSVIREGYVGVPTYGAATPAVNGTVYVRTVVGSGGEPVGSFSTQADSTNTFILTNAHFTGGKDTNGNAEIFIAANA